MTGPLVETKLVLPQHNDLAVGALTVAVESGSNMLLRTADPSKRLYDLVSAQREEGQPSLLLEVESLLREGADNSFYDQVLMIVNSRSLPDTEIE